MSCIRVCRRPPITPSRRSMSAGALAVSVYMNSEYYELGTSRAGAWDPSDLVMGGLMAALVMEYSRKRHMPLFVLNILLFFYAVYGWLVPGMFYHAGLSWGRVVTAMSVENTTGVFSNLPQIALTIIGSFLLVLSVLNGYGCIESLLRATKRVAARSPHALPQSAVVGSMCVGTVSGSGAANAITIGSATIPGHDRRRHAARHRRRDRVGIVARRPIDAAGHGRVGLPDGRIPGTQLLRRGRPRLCARAHLLRHRRGVGISPGGAASDAAGRHLVRSADLARLGQSRRLSRRDRRPGRHDGGLASAAHVRGALRLRRGRQRPVRRQSRAAARARPLVVRGIHRADPEISSIAIPR